MKGGPSDRAMEAAMQAAHGSADERKLEYSGHVLATRDAIGALHDPALGVDRSVCLRDVVERIRREASEVFGDDDYFAGLEHAADIIESEFGASE